MPALCLKQTGERTAVLHIHTLSIQILVLIYTTLPLQLLCGTQDAWQNIDNDTCKRLISMIKEKEKTEVGAMT